MNISVLEGHIPKKVIDELPSVMERFKIETPIALAHFLGQCHHESAGFTRVFENLNYRAETLHRLFPARFRDIYEAEFYVGRPEQIADRIYGRRMGNGGFSSGDGFRFRGRGYIQITGKNNYAAFNPAVAEDILEYPDLVATKYPLFSAGWWWKANTMHVHAKSLDDSCFMFVTKRVNGGTNGLAHRKTMTLKIHKILMGETDE